MSIGAPVSGCARRLVFGLGLVFCVGFGWSDQAAEGGEYRRTIEPGLRTHYSPMFRHQPKVHRYVEETDRLYRSHSVLAPTTGRRPGGDVAYHGNRLTQYRYGGTADEGGIYTAIDEYSRYRALKPAKYQYRW